MARKKQNESQTNEGAPNPLAGTDGLGANAKGLVDDQIHTEVGEGRDGLDTANRLTALHVGESSPDLPHGEIAESSADRLALAQKKLAKMEETNKVCFRFRNDLAVVEQELIRLNYNDGEIMHLMEPKGTRMIPGYSYVDIMRQRQYVNYLTARRAPVSDAGFAGAEEHRRNAAREAEIG